MSRLTISEAKNLMEAYQSVYAPQETLSTLEQEIFESIAYTLISQGYNAVDVLEYFANVDEEVIVEDIIALSEGNLLIESVVSEEYIQEQYEILNEALPAVAAGLSLAGRALLGQGARRAAGAVVKRMAGPGVRKAVKSLGSNLGKVKGALGGAVNKLKGAARGALNKLPGGSSGKVANALKTAAKWTLGGAAFEAGSRGVKALMGDKGSSGSPSADKSKWNASKALGGQAAFKAGGGAAKMKQNPGMSAADVQKLGMKNIRNKPKSDSSSPAPAAPASPGSDKRAPSSTTSTKPKPAIGKLGNTSFERRTPTSTEFKGAQEYRQQNPGAKPEDVLKAAQEAGKRQASVDADIKRTNTPAELNKPAPAGSALAKEQERRKRAAETATTASESHDAFDLVLDYLFSEGHVDTLDEALYVMMEMDAEMIADICEGIDFKGAAREQARRDAEQEKRDKEVPTNKERRLMKGRFRPGASSAERAEGGRDALKQKGKVPKKGGKDMFEQVLEHLISEGYAETEEAAREIIANMSEGWMQSIVEQSAIASRTAAVVDDQRRGSHGMAHDQRMTGDSIKKLNRYKGPIVTPGLPGA